MLNRKTRNKKDKNSGKFVKIWGYIFKILQGARIFSFHEKKLYTLACFFFNHQTLLSTKMIC